MTTKEYQNIIRPLIGAKLPDLEVKNEWKAFIRYTNHYSPRVDIAVGPFNIEPNDNQTYFYNKLLETVHVNRFLRKLYDVHCQNIGLETNNEIILPLYEELVQKNQNARCFLAIEIENQNSKKHIMGSLINAASLGRIGIGIAYTDATMRTFIRIMNYLGFLTRVGKNSYDTTNFLIVSKAQMEDLIRQID